MDGRARGGEKLGIDMRRSRRAPRHLGALGAFQHSAGHSGAALIAGGEDRCSGRDPRQERFQEARLRYYFKLYALDKVLDLKEGATKDELVKAMKDHIVAQGQLMGTFSA